MVVVAPVLNLSGTDAFDPLRLTDLLASELVSSSEVAVVPVNVTLAALARHGKRWVDTPEQALDLARELGASATIVTAITEYDPYDPPVVGLVMQWYALARQASASAFDPVTASRMAAGLGAVELSADNELGPAIQFQRVFNAADEEVLREVKRFARDRDGHESPLGHRKFTKSQQLYVRYCMWSAIQSMLRLQNHDNGAVSHSEAGS